MWANTRRVESLLAALLQKVNSMSKELDDLTAAVKKNDDAADSIIALVTGLAAQIVALKTDPAALESLAADLNAKFAAMAAAALANTPAA